MTRLLISFLCVLMKTLKSDTEVSVKIDSFFLVLIHIFENISPLQCAVFFLKLISAHSADECLGASFTD